MPKPLSEDRERKIIEEGGLSQEDYTSTIDELEQASLDMGVFRDIAIMANNKRTTIKQDQAIKIKQRIELERKKAEETAVMKTYIRWAMIYDNGAACRRFIEFEVDEAANANFLTHGMAQDRHLQIQSLGSHPFQGETINGDVVCYEYAKVTFYGGNANEPRHIEADFYILPAENPPNDPRIEKPIVGRHLLQDAGDLLLIEDPKNLTGTTKMRSETELMKEQRKQQAASVAAFQANASRIRDATRREESDKDRIQHDTDSSSSAAEVKHIQPAFPRKTETCLTGMAPSESTHSNNERNPSVSDWKLTSDSRDTEGFSQWIDSIVPETENKRSVALQIDLGSMLEFLRDEYSDLKGPTEILHILTVTGSQKIAYANTAEKYVKWQWHDGEWACHLLELLANVCIEHGKGRWGQASFDEQFAAADLVIRGQPDLQTSTDFNLTVTGPVERISDALRALAWALSVFRKPRSEHMGLFESRISLRDEVSKIGTPLFVISIEERPQITPAPDNGTCWHAIFCAFAVSTSFPIPPREGAQGIELPFNLMSLLSRVEYPIQHGNGFILKGRQSALIPTLNVSRGQQLVQWHLIQSSKDSDLSMEDVPLPVIHDNSDHSSIETIISDNKRHFLGLYDVAEIIFGTEPSQTLRICKSKPSKDVKIRHERWHFGWQKSFSVSGGFSIFGLFSIGASAPFTPKLPHNVTIDLVGKPTITDLINQASKELTLIYDTKNKLAWLLPEICVILQLMQTHAVPYSTSLWPIERMDSNLRGRVEACRELVHGLAKEPQRIFRRFCDFFRQMKEDIRLKHRKHGKFFFHRHLKTQLCGVDFVELAKVTQSAKIPSLTANINSERAGCWAEMLGANWEQSRQDAKNGHWPARGLKVVALFCHDISLAPIQHKTQSCRVWSPVPRYYDYLITTVGCVKRLREVQREERGKLSPKHWWQIGETEPFDFEACRGQRGRVNDCNRLQKIGQERPDDDDSRKLAVILDDELNKDGALAFGEKFWVSEDQNYHPCGLVPPVNTCESRSEQVDETNS